MWRRKYSPSAEIVVPAQQAASAFLQDVVIYFEEDKHALAELTVIYNLPKQAPFLEWQYPAGITWGEQSPVHFRYRMYSGDSTGDFYGYVMSENIIGTGQEMRYSGTTQITVKYTVIGMTFWMQNQADNLWKQCTPSSIARDIAHKYGMRAVTEPLGVFFDTQMQSSQSDWKFLADTVAQRISARLSMDGASTLFFTQYTTPIPSPNGSWPVFTLTKLPGVVDTLRSFQGTTGDLDPLGGYRVKQVANATSTAMPTATYSPNRDLDVIRPVQTFRQRYTLWPGRNYDEMQQFLIAQSEPLWMFAQATTDGDPRCKVGAVVELQGAGIAVDHRGKWLIRGATHRLHQVVGNPLLNTYECDLKLGRNQPNRLSEPSSRLDIGTDYGTVLVNDRWRARFVGKLSSGAGS